MNSIAKGHSSCQSFASSQKKAAKMASKTQQELLNAIDRSQVDRIRQIVSAGASINQEGDDGWLPLQHAVLSRNVDVVRALLDSGAAPDGVGSAGVTAMQVAARLGETAIVKVLLDSGADPNRRTDMSIDPSAPTPEQIARRNGHSRLADEIRRSRELPPSQNRG